MRKKIITITAIIVSLILSTPFVLLQGQELVPLDKIEFADLTPIAQQEVECLSDNIYFESAYETTDGKMAVGLVTMNRVKSGFNDSICGVVKQKIRDTCQFSWYCDTKSKLIALYKEKYLTSRQKQAYNESQNVALYIYMNYDTMKDITRGAVNYHADYVKPGWNLQKTVTIGRHIFYKP